MAALISDLGSWAGGICWLRKWPDKKRQVPNLPYEMGESRFPRGSGSGTQSPVTAPVILMLKLSALRPELMPLCTRLGLANQEVPSNYFTSEIYIREGREIKKGREKKHAVLRKI